MRLTPLIRDFSNYTTLQRVTPYRTQMLSTSISSLNCIFQKNIFTSSHCRLVSDFYHKIGYALSLWKLKKFNNKLPAQKTTVFRILILKAPECNHFFKDFFQTVLVNQWKKRFFDDLYVTHSLCMASYWENSTSKKYVLIDSCEPIQNKCSEIEIWIKTKDKVIAIHPQFSQSQKANLLELMRVGRPSSGFDCHGFVEYMEGRCIDIRSKWFYEKIHNIIELKSGNYIGQIANEHFMTECYNDHSAVYLGENQFLSIWGMEGPLLVTDLATLLKHFSPDIHRKQKDMSAPAKKSFNEIEMI